MRPIARRIAFWPPLMASTAGCASGPAAITYDPYYSHLTALLLGDGVNNGTVFTNSAPTTGLNGSSISHAGNAKTVTATKKFGTASIALDGTGDYVDINGAVEFSFFTEEFTIDMWVNLSATGRVHTLVDHRPTSTNGLYINLYVAADNTLRLYVNSADRITGTTALSSGVWYHVALSRSSGNTRLFLSGVQEGSTYADTNSYSNGSPRPRIGESGHTAGSALQGYIDDLRYTFGIGRYTGTFDVPTVAAWTTGPTLPTPSPDSLWKNVRLLVGTEDGAHFSSTITDKSPARYGMLVAGNTAWTYARKPPGYATSIDFDGTGDFLRFNSEQEHWLGNEDWTIDFYVYFKTLPSGGSTAALVANWVFAQRSYLINYASPGTWGVYLSSDGYNNTVAQTYSDPTSYVTKTSMHVAVERYQNNLYFYRDGVAIGSPVSVSGFTARNSTGYLGIGYNPDSGSDYLTGSMSAVRLTIGEARFKGAFTRPALPLVLRDNQTDASFSSVKALLYNHYWRSGSTFIRDVITTRNWSGSGNVQNTSSNPPTGLNCSRLFDGTGDWDLHGDHADWDIWAGDCTVEFYVRWSGTPGETGFMGQSNGGGAQPKWGLYWSVSLLGASGEPLILLGNPDTIIKFGAWTPSATTWYALAFVRSGNNFLFFVDGVQVGSTQVSTFIPPASSGTLRVGADGENFKTLAGQLAGVRITKGVARYTSNYTPPSLPLPVA